MTKREDISILLDDADIEDLTEILADVMEEFNSDVEGRRFTMLFAILQERYPDTLDEFTARFAERASEKEEQDND